MRSLYRFYLYTVFVLFCLYVTFTCARFLNVILNLTSLRAPYDTVPSTNDVVQTSIFTLVSLVIVGLVGGLHYWLIRRDIAQHPEAGASAIRSFFLNTIEGLAAAISLPMLGSTFLSFVFSAGDSGLVTWFSAGISILLLASLLELERRRCITPDNGVARVFLRLHLYGVQAILLLIFGIMWPGILLPIFTSLFFSSQVGLLSCSVCTSPRFLLLLIPGIWLAGSWIFYGWATSRDTSRSLRFILHGLGFATGITLLLVGVCRAVQVLLLWSWQQPVSLNSVLSANQNWTYDFISPLTFGLLVACVYHLWMRAGVRKGQPPIQTTLGLIECAVASVLAAGFFWWGLGNLLYNEFSLLFNLPFEVTSQSWSSAIAFGLAGCVCFALEYYLSYKNRRQAEIAAGPRRAQVLALLAIGTLTFSVGLAVTLYVGLTTLLGARLDNWSQILDTGLATLTVGLILAGFYLYIARHEHQFSPAAKLVEATNVEATQVDATQVDATQVDATQVDATQVDATQVDATQVDALNETAEAPAELATDPIEAILDQLLSDRMTREEAARQLHALLH